MLDPETNLEIGDPYKLPFEEFRGECVDKELQENVEKRIRFGIASASGIRQIFDDTYGDEATDYVDGTSTEITDAAKVHVATIADCFVELLREQTGQSRPTNQPVAGSTVVVAIDSRHTGPAIADIVIRILAFHGVNVRYTFITPITEVAVYSREVSDGFVYISASHNPKGYNGLKLGLNDGRVLPRHLALPFIEKYQARLRDQENTKSIIHKVNSAKPDRVQEIYNEIDGHRKESRKIYARFSDQMITGLKDPEEVAGRKESLRKEIQAKGLWIGLDPNGGARKDKEYLESWGFHVLEVNGRPRLDMAHELAPVPSACEQAREALIKAQGEGKNVIAFFAFDTDGDRKNIVIPDGKGGAVIPGVQMIFALDVLCSVLDEGRELMVFDSISRQSVTLGKSPQPPLQGGAMGFACKSQLPNFSVKDHKLAIPLEHPEVGVVVNGPTSSLMEQLAHYLNFTIKRVEVGEANVATGGIALHNQGFHVPVMGEGSNGSVFNLDLLVREPLHTVRTLINFITRPELTEMLLNCLHQVNRNKLAACSTEDQNKLAACSTNDENKLAACFTEDKYDDWRSPERIGGLLMNIINALPPSVTTDFFTEEGIRRSGYDLPQELFKANFDAHFESQLWPRIAEEIRENFQGEPMAEFVNYEGEDELRGKGNRKTSTGGYKVEFYVRMQEGDKRHIGWIWFRSSGTERGVMRRGVSISHWDVSNPQAAEVVHRLYKHMDAILANALNIVEEKTLKMCPDQPRKR